MKLIVLNENNAGGHYLAEHGLSYLVEINGKKVLFDTGHSDVFLKNARNMEICLEKEVKTVVLSHGHWDHGNGLNYLTDTTLITHPASFTKRFRKRNHTPLGLNLSKANLEEKFSVITTQTPYLIAPGLTFLGEIPRNNDFEAQTTTFIDENGNDDFVPDDSALVAEVKDNKIVIITGCSHSGICNICEYAKMVTGKSAIKAVIGGFHLKENNLQTIKTIHYFEKNKAEQLLPSHCTELPALAEFYRHFKIGTVKTGDIYHF
ncbi:MAG: MBL fold metallo-hydrolase [Draconibacterium sp.]|nr:MAG: MBL fold metallo-hydrolase [Draconibacterium sp.]PIF05547.1 MAG: MBL fold metallo-hydrolase [Draconibacterium sp.]